MKYYNCRKAQKEGDFKRCDSCSDKFFCWTRNGTDYEESMIDIFMAFAEVATKGALTTKEIDDALIEIRIEKLRRGLK